MNVVGVPALVSISVSVSVSVFVSMSVSVAVSMSGLARKVAGWAAADVGPVLVCTMATLYMCAPSHAPFLNCVYGLLAR